MLSGISYRELKELPAGDIIFDPTVTHTLDHSNSDNKDTQICSYSSYTTYNYGGRTYDIKAFHRSSYEYRTLLEFNCGTVANLQSVQTATLTMYAMSFASVADNVNVYELNTEWVEGTEDGTANQTGVTWNTYNGTNNWTSGGDFNTTVKGTDYIEQVGTCTFSLDATMVAGWLTNSANNHGIILACSRDIAGSGDECRIGFSTSADADTNKRPRLVITYTEGTGSAVTPLPAGTTFYIRGADGNVVATYKAEETSQ